MNNTTRQKKFFQLDWNKTGWKTVILISVFSVLLLIFFTFNRYIGSSKVKETNEVFLGYSNLFNFSNITFKSRNFAVLIAIVLTFSNLIYATYSAYRLWTKHFKIIYLNLINFWFYLLSATSIILLVIMPIQSNFQVFGLVYFAIPLLITLLSNLILQSLIYKENKKLNPSQKALVLMPLISLIIKNIIFITGFVLLIYITKGTNKIDTLLSLENANYKKIDLIFNTKNNTSWIFISWIAIFLIAALILNLYPLWKKNNKFENNLLFKDLLLFGLTTLLATLIFAAANLINLKNSNGIFTQFNTNHLVYGLSLLFFIVIFVGYILVDKLLIKNNQLKLNSFIFLIANFIVIVYTLTIRIINFDKINNYLIPLFLALYFIGVFVYKKYFSNQKEIFTFVLITTLLSFILFFQTLDLLMSNQENNLLSSIFVLFNLIDLLLLALALIIFIPILSLIANWFKLFIYVLINQKNQKLKKEVGKNV